MLKIKNWTDYQHYSKRRPIWIKLHRQLLDDREWFELDPVAAKTLVSLWLIASEADAMDGTLPEIADLAFRLRMPVDQFEALLPKLSHWIEDVASNLLADRYQLASLEVETETETEVEAEGASTPATNFSDWHPQSKTIAMLKAEGHSAEKIERVRAKFVAHGGASYDKPDAAFRKWVATERTPPMKGHGDIVVLDAFGAPIEEI